MLNRRSSTGKINLIDIQDIIPLVAFAAGGFNALYNPYPSFLCFRSVNFPTPMQVGQGDGNRHIQSTTGCRNPALHRGHVVQGVFHPPCPHSSENHLLIFSMLVLPLCVHPILQPNSIAHAYASTFDHSSWLSPTSLKSSGSAVCISSTEHVCYLAVCMIHPHSGSAFHLV
jgi:hypothetical protein